MRRFDPSSPIVYNVAALALSKLKQTHDISVIHEFVLHFRTLH